MSLKRDEEPTPRGGGGRDGRRTAAKSSAVSRKLGGSRPQASGHLGLGTLVSKPLLWTQIFEFRCRPAPVVPAGHRGAPGDFSQTRRRLHSVNRKAENDALRQFYPLKTSPSFRQGKNSFGLSGGKTMKTNSTKWDAWTLGRAPRKLEERGRKAGAPSARALWPGPAGVVQDRHLVSHTETTSFSPKNDHSRY